MMLLVLSLFMDFVEVNNAGHKVYESAFTLGGNVASYQIGLRIVDMRSIFDHDYPIYNSLIFNYRYLGHDPA